MSRSRTGEIIRWLLPRISLAVIVPMLALIGVEAGARRYLGDSFVRDLPIGRPDRACAQPDPQLGWSNLPNVHARVDAPHFSYWLHINSAGLRDAEHPRQKPPGTIRIALLGDSLAWGWGVDNGKAFADLIEPELGPNVEVINFGVPGYSTDQQVLLFERDVLSYQPDIVLLCFVLNDVVGNHEREYQGRFKPRFERRGSEWVLAPCPAARPQTENARDFTSMERLYWGSALLQAMLPPDGEQHLALAAQRAIDGNSNSEPVKRTNRHNDRRVTDEIRRLCDQVSDSDSVTHYLLGTLNEACRKRDLPLVAFSIAHHHDKYLYWVDVERPETNGQELRTDLTVRLAEAGARLGFRTFSVDQAMYEETGRGNVLTCGDSHLNELGNRVVARRIVEELRPALSSWPKHKHLLFSTPVK